MKELCIIEFIINQILNGLLYEKQFGFRKKLTRDITGSFEKREYTLGFFIDISKAFETLDYQILIKILQYYGIDGTA